MLFDAANIEWLIDGFADDVKKEKTRNKELNSATQIDNVNFTFYFIQYTLLD